LALIRTKQSLLFHFFVVVPVQINCYDFGSVSVVWSLYVWSIRDLPMDSTVFGFSLIFRGHHRKDVAIYNDAQVNLQAKPWFNLT
jgi:hypothetical protein